MGMVWRRKTRAGTIKDIGTLAKRASAMPKRNWYQPDHVSVCDMSDLFPRQGPCRVYRGGIRGNGVRTEVLFTCSRNVQRGRDRSFGVAAAGQDDDGARQAPPHIEKGVSNQPYADTGIWADTAAATATGLSNVASGVTV